MGKRRLGIVEYMHIYRADLAKNERFMGSAPRGESYRLTFLLLLKGIRTNQQPLVKYREPFRLLIKIQKGGEKTQ